jgi:hypothetical protein
VYRWELDGPAQQEFADLPPGASIPRGIHGRWYAALVKEGR